MLHSPWHPVIPSNQLISIPGPPQREAENTIPPKEYLKRFNGEIILEMYWGILMNLIGNFHLNNYVSLPHIFDVVRV